MKVLQINAVYKIRSTGRIVLELDQFLKRNGIESYVACSEPNGSEGAYLIGGSLEKKLHALLSRISGLQGYFSRRGTKKLIQYMEQIKPDIVHLGNMHANYVNLPMILSYLAEHDIGTVVTLHDCWFYTGKCMYYTTEGCQKWREGCGHCPQLRKDNKSWFFDRTDKIWKDKKEWLGAIPRLAVIGVSDWITKEAKQSLLGDAGIIRRVYNWIDLDIFRYKDSVSLRDKWMLKDHFFILGVASRWNDRKGIDIFIRLARKMKKSWRIVLVGDIQQRSLPDGMIHIPETNDAEELAGYYSMADVFLQLSLEETFGNVVAEALACGTPVITIDSTANGELVDETCGFVLDTPDISHIVDSLDKVERRGKAYYADSCRKFAEDHFKMEDRIREYMEVYHQLMEIGNQI